MPRTLALALASLLCLAGCGAAGPAPAGYVVYHQDITGAPEELWIVRGDGSGERRLKPDASFWTLRDVDARGQLLLHRNDGNGGPAGVFRFDPHDGIFKRLADERDDCAHFFGADRLICFPSHNDGKHSDAVVRADGAAPRTVL